MSHSRPNLAQIGDYSSSTVRQVVMVALYFFPQDEVR